MKFPHSKIFRSLYILSFTAFVAACGATQSLDGEELNQGTTPAVRPSHIPYSNFRGQETKGERNFANLINNYPKAKSKPTPWVGSFFPYVSNGIALPSSDGGGSPAGKYDAARGGRTQAQLWEVKNHGAAVPKVEPWWGHCNGWAAAAALYPQPLQPVTVNGINFTVGDIKALLTEIGMSVVADYFGERADIENGESPKIWDTVPDQFFLVLTNYMGKDKKTVLIDRFTGQQVWNQPLAAYKFAYPKREDYVGASREAPDVYRINVSAAVWWMDDGVGPDEISEPFQFGGDNERDLNELGDVQNGHVVSRTFRMELWLDGPVVFDANGKITESGNIIVTRKGEYLDGGKWLMGEGYTEMSWPDYMWVPYTFVKPTDPEQTDVNPEVDLDWVTRHILVPGGADDGSVQPGQVVPPPRPVPSGFPPFPGNGGGFGPNFPFPGGSSTTPPGLPPVNGGSGTSTPGLPPATGGGGGGTATTPGLPPPSGGGGSGSPIGWPSSGGGGNAGNGGGFGGGTISWPPTGGNGGSGGGGWGGGNPWPTETGGSWPPSGGGGGSGWPSWP